MKQILPSASSPGKEPSALWSVQLQLLKLAEDTLGPRDASKTICQPVFTDHDPNIRNTPNLDGAFAELSRYAEGYWPTVVNELAHETVHLLNPKPGVGTWLSEGVAVGFSNYAQQQFELEPQRVKKPSLPGMESQLELSVPIIQALSGDCVKTASRSPDSGPTHQRGLRHSRQRNPEHS